MESVWNSLEITKVIVSVLTPLAVILFGYWINRRLREIESTQQQARDDRKLKADQERDEQRQRYEDRKEAERLEREERKNEIERRYEPHIEFKIDCQFFGPIENQYLANFLLIAINRGHVQHRFPSIMLRVLGIKRKETFQYWKEREPRAKFPHNLFEEAGFEKEAEVVPPRWNYILVEPGVAQQINFSTVIPVDYSFIVARAEFHYDKFTPHSVEGVFSVPLHNA